MSRNLYPSSVMSRSSFFTASPVLTAQFGTADEAKAMLERAAAR